MPSHIISRFPDSQDTDMRDKYRADLIRQFFEN